MQWLPFNALEILWDRTQWMRLFITYLLLSLPFLFVANAIAMTMLRYNGLISRIYGVDLIGAGAGVLIILLLLVLFDTQLIVRMLAIAGLLAAMLSILQFERLHKSAAMLVLLVMGIAIVLPASWLELRMSQFKGLEQTLLVKGSRLVDSHSSPVSRVDVVASRDVPFRNAPGLSLMSPALPPEQLAVFRDGDTMTTIDHYLDKNSADYTDYMTAALPYHLGRAFKRTLILNLETGGQLLPALHNSVARIDAVEPDSQLLELFSQDFAEYSGWQQMRDRVVLHNTTARAFAASAEPVYDNVVIGVPGSSTGGAAGVYAFAADYTLTVEALESYWKLLCDEGLLAITLWTSTPPKENLRLFATAVKALKNAGVEKPAEQVAWIRSWNTATLLIRKGRFSELELDKIRQFSATRGFDLAWLPGLGADEVNQYQLLPKPYYYSAAKALLSEGARDFLDDYEYDIAPVSDSAPYFSDHFRWNSLSDFMAVPGRGGMSLIGVGYPTLLVTLAQALVAAFVLILLPLFFLKKQKAKHHSDGRRILVYFMSIGIAFLFIEISFIEMFTLILGQPLYAVAVALSAFLLFSGLGSISVQRVIDRRSNQAIPSLLGKAVFGIVALALIYVVFRADIVCHIMVLPEYARILSAFILAAPMAFVMGVPFPLGLTATSESATSLLPWAWGINGCASVLSAILAVLLAMEIGFNGVMLCAAILYLLAWKSMPAH
jgi:hypothetical protein